MTDKQINTCEFLNICKTNCSGTLEDTEVCHCYELYKQLDQLKAENEDLKSVRDMWMSKCEQEMKTSEFFQDVLAEFKAENAELIRRITKIFACLIKANRTNKIVDTLWVDNITTLWDYIAQTLGIEGDQIQIEEQVLKRISEVKV